VILLAEPLTIAVKVVRNVDVDEALEALLFERYGVGDLADVEGATDRVVKRRTSPTWSVRCMASCLCRMPADPAGSSAAKSDPDP
jgi:hypothetical protein